MKTFKHIVLAFAAILLVASCAIDEMWQGSDIQDEERVLTFKPRFEDFEAATKAIGDGNKVNKLLVHVYEGDSNAPLKYSYDIDNKKIDGPVSIPFFKTKEYKVYFFAYNDESSYVVSDIGLKGGVTVTYPDPDAALNFDALESLDAFYSVKKVNLSDKSVDTGVSLTRPFAQVNLTADKAQLLAAKATKVEIAVKAATSYDFVNAPTEEELAEQTFTFGAADFFQTNEEISEGIAYLGTTYLFVPSGDALPATVTLYDEDGNPLREASEVEIPLVSNNRINLVFSGIEPAGPLWDDNEVNVPGAGADGWIHITRPEQLAAFLLNTTADGAQVCIDNDIDMSEIPEEVTTNLAKASKSVKSLILNGNNKTISGLNLSAFFNEATNLTVYDLTLSRITVKGTSHVGVLVNTLKGKSSFSNVNILNSSAATTNGAAGGMVGYIVRKSETDRSESMAISFTDCQVISTSATGKESAGKFVGKFSGYDNGETLTFTDCSTSEASASADNASPYVEGNKGAWLADTDFSTFDSWLGDEAYYRGVVTFDGVRFQPKWDGEKTIDPLLANKTYDAGTTAGANRYVVYSAFDLAGLRKKTPSPTALYLMTNVDMFGQGEDGKFFVPNEFMSACTSTDDKVFNSFTSISTLEGFNNTIYGLKIEHLKQGSTSAAFIGTASGTTYHQNINFDNCCVVSTHKDVKSDAKAYGAIVCCNPSGTYTQKYVKANNCKVYALQKVGTLSSRVSGNSVLSNNSISNCYIENYDCRISETFTSGKIEIYDNSVTVSADFYPAGEVGGMYGFIQDVALISDCSVINTVVHALGQADIEATIKGSGLLGYLAVLAVKGFGYYLVPGRHVSTMIGDIRLTNGDIEISNCSVDADSKCTNTYNSHNSTYTYIGQAYTVAFVADGGTFKINNNQVTIADCNKNTKL